MTAKDHRLKDLSMPDVIVKIQPGKARRIFSAILLCLVALVMLNLVFTGSANSVVLKTILLSMSCVFLWQAQTSLRSADAALVLTRDGLFDGQGELICSISQIVSVDRGWFSLKPSNGFLIRLHEPAVRKWSPGLYWRIGTRLGVGGALSPAQTKELSDKLMLLVEERKLNVELV